MAAVAAPPPDAFEVAWISPLKLEVDACRGAFTQTYDIDSTDYKKQYGLSLMSDKNNYHFGKIHQFNVVLCQPGDERGGQRVAYTAYHELKNGFLKIKYLFLVGVAGGAPKVSNDPDIRLGDVVLGLPAKGHSGVMQIDGGWQMDSSLPIPTTPIYPPNEDLVHWANEVRKAHEKPGGSAVGRLSQTVDIIRNNLPTDAQLASGLSWEYPGIENDILFPRKFECQSQVSNKDHKNWCPAKCDPQRQVTGRPKRVVGNKVQTIHGGLICSVDKVVMDATIRNEIAKKIYNERKRAELLCYEMEGYGIAETVSILQVRGICDYSDRHKTKRWQPYAALQAAAVARLIMDCLSISIYQFQSRTLSRALTMNSRSTIGENTQVSGASGGAWQGTATIFTEQATEEPLPYGDTENLSLKRTFTEIQGATGYGQPKSGSNQISRRAATDDATPHTVEGTAASRPNKDLSHHRRSSKIHQDVNKKMKTKTRDADDFLQNTNIGSNKAPINPTTGGKEQSKRNSINQIGQDKGKARMLSISESTEGEREDAPESQHVEDVDSNVSGTGYPRDEPSPIDGGETVPEFYQNTGSFPRNRIVHKCKFKIYIKALDEDCEDPRYLTTKYGPFEAEWTVEAYNLDSETMSKRLFFHLLDSEDDLCLWVPVDAVTVSKQVVKGKQEYEYCWSDCEAYNVKSKDYITYPYYCYNASKPNIHLRIKFDNQQAENDFRCLMINPDLRGSEWEPLGETTEAHEMVDRNGRRLKLYQRKQTGDRSRLATTFLIAAYTNDDADGSSLKLYRLKEFKVLERPLEAQTVFDITSLEVLNYSTKTLKPETDTRFQCESKRGEPLYQSWGKHEKNSFFISKNTSSDLNVVLPYKVFVCFLDLVLSWKLGCYTGRAKLVTLRAPFPSWSIEGPIMFGHSKDEPSQYHLMCYDVRKSEWHILEIAGSQMENSKEIREGKISLRISKGTTTKTMKAGQFNELGKNATCRTIEFKVDDDVRTFCDVLRASGLWPLRRSATR